MYNFAHGDEVHEVAETTSSSKWIFVVGIIAVVALVLAIVVILANRNKSKASAKKEDKEPAE